ncbi:aspartate/glutamate racemase family protein [Actinomadura sp. DC4]|uniref:aspartate/glutamate racemase family protein n=1 Tax=Actinomadura sp. DC4 TaxID=3055069 RepID=UPI0025B1FD18|nr:aspartate/glutamate racemase family protein [Actinomadura sp. DC4]MDN3356421.1 aspartate/glutamate racemase family protein [Actinomadura sp. DC4]
MLVYAITPIHVPDEELRRRQRRYDHLSPDGLTVELHDIGTGAPRALETSEQVRESERQVAAALRDVGPAYDALLPDCVLDPGVAAAREAGVARMDGMLRLSLAHAAREGRTVGAVTRNRAIADELTAVAATYGHPVHEVAILDLGLDAIADDARWVAAMTGAVEALAAAGAEVVVNGCSAVDLDAAGGTPVPVIDPAALALRMLAAGERV